MKKIKILQTCVSRMPFKPGDELHVQEISPELQALIDGTRLDGEKVAVVMSDRQADEEIADRPNDTETAVTGRGRRGQRTEDVPR